MDTRDLDTALLKRGWTYEVENEEFQNRGRRLDYQTVVATVPGMTLELASYENDRWDKLRTCQGRTTLAKKAVNKKG